MEEAGHANRALVIEASDTLFNRRDYTAAQRFWSPHYIQHSAHIQRGRDAEKISTVDGIDFAYRRLGSGGDLPLVFCRLLRFNMDDWDSLIVDGLAADREVITFDYPVLRNRHSTGGE